MRRLQLFTVTMFVLSACGGSQSTGSANGSGTTAETGTPSGDQGSGSDSSAGDNEFELHTSDTAGQAHGDHPSEIEATATEAAMRLFVVNPDTGPIQGIVIKLTGPDGTSYYTGETDSQGYAEVLVPAGQRYQIEYLSLGRRNTSAAVEVPEGPNQDIRLTMRYRRIRPLEPEQEERFVFDGVFFDTGSANIQSESFPRLDRVVEYMAHRPNVRIRVSGHTDNVGDPQRNQRLSEQRAQAVRQYLVSHGIDGSRVEAVGFGDTQPVASNDTEDGRAQNRRIEAIEL